jgi:hypothetical protein
VARLREALESIASRNDWAAMKLLALNALAEGGAGCPT